MKATLALCLALLTAASVQADVYGLRGVRGGGGGAWVNHSRGHDQGHHHRSHGHPWRYSGYVGYRSPWFGYYPGYAVRYYPHAQWGYGTGYYDSGYYGGVTYSQPAYYGSSRGLATGAVLGAIAGGIIGHNSGDLHHNGWRGAGLGAVIGGMLGSVADANRRVVTPAPVYQTAPATATYAAPAQSTQPVTIINNYYNAPTTPMSAANGLFGR
jgi:hypothetical protein